MNTWSDNERTADTLYCTRCGCEVSAHDNAGDEETPLCQPCYDANYTSCSSCGTILHVEDAIYESDDDDTPYCETCYNARRNQGIRNYYYKPAPIFYGEGNRYFGVELEIDEGGECQENANELMSIGNAAAPHIYCKHDGSLNDGFEIVTHPMTLDYHTKKMPWAALLDKADEQGYSSHRAKTCGLHIHVNRDAFGAQVEEQDACIARILYFFEKHWEELLKFSRRTARQVERWASRYGLKEYPKDILDHVKKGRHAGRYTCVNLENSDTVEFRIFRGTLKQNTLTATLQLVNRVCDVAFSLTDDEMRGLSWTTFVAACTEPELVRYLKERRLYVNDPVESEAEI